MSDEGLRVSILTSRDMEQRESKAGSSVSSNEDANPIYKGSMLLSQLPLKGVLLETATLMLGFFLKIY